MNNKKKKKFVLRTRRIQNLRILYAVAFVASLAVIVWGVVFPKNSYWREAVMSIGCSLVGSVALAFFIEMINWRAEKRRLENIRNRNVGYFISDATWVVQGMIGFAKHKKWIGDNPGTYWELFLLAKNAIEDETEKKPRESGNEIQYRIDHLSGVDEEFKQWVLSHAKELARGCQLIILDKDQLLDDGVFNQEELDSICYAFSNFGGPLFLTLERSPIEHLSSITDPMEDLYNSLNEFKGAMNKPFEER